MAANLLENATDIFDPTMFKGIYRDDGFVVFKDNLLKSEVAVWLERFQERIDELAESKFLKFTAVIWGNDKEDGKKYNNVLVNRSEYFPYLDMEMFWLTENDLNFQVHLKLNQQLKYLNKGSTHTEACFVAIPSGVVRRLALLTMRTNELEDIRMDELYPLHAKALWVANLAPPIFPTHGEILDSLTMREPKENDKCNNNKKGGDKWMV